MELLLSDPQLNLTRPVYEDIRTWQSSSTSLISVTTTLHQQFQISQRSIMSGFPKLQPAFTVRVVIDAPMAVGGQAGTSLVIVVSCFDFELLINHL